MCVCSYSLLKLNNDVFVIKGYHMSTSKNPTLDELNKAESYLDRFDKHLQNGAVFNEPLSSSERAIIKTFLLWLILHEDLDISD